MDVYCANCKEPWDTHHLWHDMVHDTEAGQLILDDELGHEDYLKRMSPQSRAMVPFQGSYTGETWERKLTPYWRAQFKAIGFQFGSSVVAVLRCNCCPKGASIDPTAIHNTRLISNLLEGDEDGIASFLSDYGTHL